MDNKNLVRKLLRLFGGNASDNQAFGTQVAGTKILSNDPDTLQTNAFLDGWKSATVSGLNLPVLQEMQGLQYVFSYFLGYLLRRGCSEYLATETYMKGDICNVIASDGKPQIFYSAIDNNINNNPINDTQGNYWKNILSMDNTFTGQNTFKNQIILQSDALSRTLLKFFLQNAEMGSIGYESGSLANIFLKLMDAKLLAIGGELDIYSNDKLVASFFDNSITGKPAIVFKGNVEVQELDNNDYAIRARAKENMPTGDARINGIAIYNREGREIGRVQGYENANKANWNICFNTSNGDSSHYFGMDMDGTIIKDGGNFADYVVSSYHSGYAWYMKWKSGFIMQGNREFYSLNWASKNFVTPFSNDASITLTLGKINVDGNGDTGFPVTGDLNSSKYTTTQFALKCNSGPGYAMWMACGY